MCAHVSECVRVCVRVLIWGSLVFLPMPGRFLFPPYFQFPEFYSFPPFFTIQPVLASREKQLALWRELILRYHTENKIKTLVVVRIG